MANPRFYTPNTSFTVGERALLTSAARHHAGRVLRMVAGDYATLFDGSGTEASGPIAFADKDAWISVESVATPTVETPVRIALVQALVAPEKMDWIVEKAVETGVAHLVVIPATRTKIKLTRERLASRLLHWHDVVVSASEQCGRNTLMQVEFMTQSEAWKSLKAQERYILAPGTSRCATLSKNLSVAFAVGPEGGFDEAEIALAVEAGWSPALIGPRVLRTETAGIVAAALANAASGDYDFS